MTERECTICPKGTEKCVHIDGEGWARLIGAEVEFGPADAQAVKAYWVFKFGTKGEANQAYEELDARFRTNDPEGIQREGWPVYPLEMVRIGEAGEPHTLVSTRL